MKTKTHTITYKPLDSLVAYKNNSRTHSEKQVEQIAASIKEFGWTIPILVDESDMILAGHGRKMAAMKLGLSEAPCIVLSGLSEYQKKAYVIADNKLAENAGWDKEMLQIEIKDLDFADFDLGLLGFSDVELSQFLEPEPSDGATDDDVDLSLPNIPSSAIGDVWICGSHRVMCGDSTNAAHVAQLMGGERVDLVVTDPPYNVAYTGKTKDALEIQNDSMDASDFYNFLLAAYRCMYDACSDGAAIYVFHADIEGVNFRQAMTGAGFKLSQCCVWVKNAFVLGRQDYHWQHEPVLCGWKPTGPHRWYSDRKQTTVWNFDRPQRNAEHPTMKPVDLISYPLLNSSGVGQGVLDLFLGGGGNTNRLRKTPETVFCNGDRPKVLRRLRPALDGLFWSKCIFRKNRRAVQSVGAGRLT